MNRPVATPLAADCPLCREDGGLLLLRRPLWRVVRVTDTPAFPAFYRLVWNAHVAEFSALAPAERVACMEAVAVIERVLLKQMQPTKINLASLGNVVPHLHWHVIARFAEDSHFPNPIWGETRRPVALPSGLDLPALDAAVLAALQAL
jgi:diadenosine tetraphosphate (Ap4A) HIT family hydrolase